MGTISINELNENLKKAITDGALDDESYANLYERADSNLQKLQTLITAQLNDEEYKRAYSGSFILQSVNLII